MKAIQLAERETKVITKKPLGTLLRQAALISYPQLEVALKDQQEYPNLLIGEILVLRGWIKKNTVNFFAEDLHTILQQKKQYPIGYYLQQAALLNKRQIELILAIQKNKTIAPKFGELAVSQGWLKQNTIDFFLSYLSTNNQFNLGEDKVKDDFDSLFDDDFDGLFDDDFDTSFTWMIA